MRGKHNKLGEGERQVRLSQDSFGNKNGNEQKLCMLFYPLPIMKQYDFEFSYNTEEVYQFHEPVL